MLMNAAGKHLDVRGKVVSFKSGFLFPGLNLCKGRLHARHAIVHLYKCSVLHQVPQ